MKKQHLLLSLMAVLLSLLSAQDIMAKTETRQDALYIFRNDGGFDFFFYGDIDHICYSKIDTAGIEQPDYVVQEVWALDTVYRIPLTAIDSVAFITPETKVWPDVFCPDDRIGNYIIASDSVWWIRLSHDTPPDLLPKKDGKLLIEDGVSPLIPDGFGGRVGAVVHEDSGSWLVVTLPTDVTDIYQQLVAKAAAATPNARRQSPKRVSDGTYYTDVPEKTIQIPDVDQEISITKGIALTPDGSSISISADLTGSIHPKFSSDLTYRACLFISPLQNKLTFSSKSLLHYTSETEYKLAGDLNSRAELGISKTVDKIERLKFNFGVGLYIEGSIGGYEVSCTVKDDGDFACFSQLNNEHFMDLVTLDPSNTVPTFDFKRVPTQTSITWKNNIINQDTGWPELPNSASIGGGVFAKAQTELAIPLSKVRKVMPDWLAQYVYEYAPGALLDSVRIGFELSLDLGGKLSMKAPWRQFIENVPLLDQDGHIYNELNEGCDFNAEVHDKFTAKFDLGLWSPGISPEVSVPSKSLGLVPDIWDLLVAISPYQDPIKPYLYRFTSPITRDLFLPVEVGFLVLDINNDIEAKYCGIPWSGDESFENDPGHQFFKDGTYFRAMSIDPGKGEPKSYWAYPMVRLINGNELLVDRYVEFEVDSAQFNIPQRIVYVGPQGGMIQGEYVGEKLVEVIPNMENVRLSTQDNWIEGLRWLGDDNKLAFFWKDLPELPEGEKQRRGTIYLTGLSKWDEVLVEDSITVIQAPSFIVVEPNKMEFPIEGGTQTATIVETTLSNITARISTSDYADVIHVSLDGNVITVTADENPDEGQRSTWVILEGKGPDGLPVSSYAIDITQEGTGGDPDPGNPSNQRRMLNDAFLAHYVRLRVIYYDEIKEDYDTTYHPSGKGMSFDADIEEDEGTYSETITEDGNNLHFVLTASNDLYWFDRESATLSFDIIDYKNPPVVGRHQLSNIKFVHDWESETGIGHDEVDIASLPLTKVEDDEYMGFHQYFIESNTHVYDGLEITRAVYYVYNKTTQEESVNYTPILDYPYNAINMYIDFMGDIGEYFVWNEEYGLWMPEGFDPSDLPDYLNKAKNHDEVKALMESRKKEKKERTMKTRIQKQ